ncbi:hypothetical protein BDZ97DRAFT_331645 [Flammula alnicola]|nr:hypothetical protein BDZ97DRAFT_331645 [Flammula alnicola]
MAKTSPPTEILADFWKKHCNEDPKLSFDLRECLRQSHERLKKWETKDLYAGAARDDVDDMLELGIRLASGMHIPFDDDAAIGLFKKIAQGNYAKDKRAIAANLLCQCLTRNFILGRSGPSEYIATFTWAEMSCKLGLFTQASLHLAMIFDAKGDDVDREGPFAEFTCFWSAYHKFREDTGLQRRNARRCVACDKKHEQRSMLKKCAGDCPSEAKPVYCSRRCQKAHWSKHRQWCKPDPAGSNPDWITDSEDEDY